MATLEEVEAELARKGQDTSGTGITVADVDAQIKRRETAARVPQTTLEAVGDTVGRFGSGANKVIAETLGLPVDAMNFVLRTAGLPVSDVPAGGTESIKRALSALGIESKSEGFTGRVGESVGAAVIPTGVTLGLARTGISAAKPVIGPIVEAARQSPMFTSAMEFLTGVTGGAGAATAQAVFPGDKTAETFGEIAGGFAPLGLARRTANLGMGLVEPFTPAGQRREASRRLQQASRDPSTASADIGAGKPDVSGARFTGPQLANDPGLLALERSVVRSKAELHGEAKDFETSVMEGSRRQLQTSLGGDAPPGAMTEFAQGKSDRLIGLVDERVSLGIAKAQRRATDARPQLGREESNLAAKEEINLALKDARAQETGIWGEIYKDRGVSTVPLREAVNSMFAQRLKATNPDDFPADIIKIIKGEKPRMVETGVLDEFGNPIMKATKSKAFGDTEPVEEILELRSNILQAKRVEAAKDAPNRKLLNNLDDLQESALNSLGIAQRQARGPEAAQIQAALDYSRALNDRFTRGPIGKLLGYDVAGGQRTPDLMTLERLLVPGPQGGVSADALVAAAGGSDRLQAATRDVIRHKFFEQATDSQGKVIASAAQQFVKKHTALLERFPQLRDELADVAGQQAVADAIAQRGTALKRGILDKRHSRAALYLDKEPERAVAGVFASAKPSVAMADLAQMAKRDPTGEAFEGLKQGFYEYIQRQVKLRTLDQSGKRLLSAAKMREVINDPVIGRVMTTLYSPQEIANVRAVSRALDVAERSATSGMRGSSDTFQNMSVLTMAAARVVGGTLGARVGGFLGGSPLVTANIGRSAFVRFVSDMPERKVSALIERAIFNPDVMKTMLTRVTEKNANALRARLHGHLAALGGDEDE